MPTINDICKTIGQDVAACRKLRRITSTDLAARLGVSRQTVSRLENGDPGLGIGHYVKAASIFGMQDVIANIFAPENDPHANRLAREALPQRVREETPETSLGGMDF